MLAPRALVTALALAFVACGDDPKPDKTAPLVTITTPAAGAVIASTVRVEGTVSDPKGKGEVKPSGVANVTVNGVVATLTDGTFAADLVDLPAGPNTISVVATDKKGNEGTATVSVTVASAVALLIEPFALRLEGSGETRTLEVRAMAADGAQRLADNAELTFISENPAIAEVDATGTVTAVGDGLTRVNVQGFGAEGSLSVQVQLDIEPPNEPSILSYLPETNGKSQGWIGRTEPFATVVIAGAAAPITKVADPGGRFFVDVPLVRGRNNDITVAVTDRAGNTSRAFPFPIRQNDAASDRGMLHISFGKAEVAFGAELEGLAGEVLPHPMMARATDNEGRPLTNVEVEFIVSAGAGSVSALGPLDTTPVARAVATTDSEGYARVWWRLSGSALDENELMARLPGDLGVPILWQANGLFAASGPTTIRGRVADEAGIGVRDLLVQLTHGDTRARTDELGEFVIDVPESTFTNADHAIPGSSGRVVTVLLNADQSGGGARMTRNTYPLTVFPGRENSPLGAFNLPRLPEGVALAQDASGVVTEAVMLTSQIDGQELPTTLSVPVGTLVTWPAGLHENQKRLTILQVPVNATPMPMPDGYFTSYIIGIQPGGTTFDPPLPIRIPNVDGHPPGAIIDLRAWDHVLARYVDSGRGRVTEDGVYVDSEPGAGIRMGAWHGATREPDDPCFVNFTLTDPGLPPTKDEKVEVELPKDDEQDCVCKISGVASACKVERKGEPGKPPTSQTIRVPCGTPLDRGSDPNDETEKKDKPELPKIEVECKPKKKGIHIYAPPRSEKPIEVRTGTELPFHAKCEDGKSDGSIKWSKTGGTAANLDGPAIKVKFEVEGTFTVSASGTTKTCKGSDSRVIKVLPCVDAGQVRVCGKDIKDEGGGKFTVGPSATIGVVKPTAGDETITVTPEDPDHAGQFLRCSKTVNVNTNDPPSVTASCALSMDIGLAAITSRKISDFIIYQGAFSISGERAITLQIANYEGPTKGFQFDLSGLPLALTNTPVTLMPDGIGIDTPDLQFMRDKVLTDRVGTYKVKECGKKVIDENEIGEKIYAPDCDSDTEFVEETAPNDLQVSVTGLFLSPTRSTISASLDYKKEIEFKIGALTRIALSYDGAADKWAGALGFAFGPPIKRTGIEVGGELTKGKVTSASITASFRRRSAAGTLGVQWPGIPLPPSSPGPFFLESVGATVTNPCALNDSCPGLFPSFAVTADTVLAPIITVFGTETKLWSGKLTGTYESYPTKLTLKGDAKLLGRVTVSAQNHSAETVSKGMNIDGLGTLNGELGLELGNSNNGDFKVYAKGSLTINNPFDAASALYTSAFDCSLTRAGNNVKGNATLSGSLFVPKFKILGVEYGGQKYAGATGMLRTQSAPAPGEPAGELSGDVTLGFGLLGESKVHVDMSFEKGVFMYATNTYAGFVPLGFVKGMIGTYSNTPSAPTLGLSADSGPQITAFDGSAPIIELLEDVENLWIEIEHTGTVAADLQLADGTIITADAVIGDPAAMPAFFIQGAGVFDQPDRVQRTTWVVPMAEAGTYRLIVTDNAEQVQRVIARVAPKPVSFYFDEPITTADGAADIAWNATHSGPVRVELFYTAVDGGGDLLPIAEVTSGDSVSWPLADVAPGSYTVVARVDGGDGPAQLIRSRSTVRVESDAPTVRLVRANDDRVSWLPAAGAGTYVVRASPRYVAPPFLTSLAGAGPFTLPGAAGSDTLTLCRSGDTQVAAPETRASIPGYVDGCGYDVIVGVQGEAGLTSFAPSVSIVGSLEPTTAPRALAEVGKEWIWDPGIVGRPELVVMTLAQGFRATAAGVTWVPAASDAGKTVEVGLAVRRSSQPLLLVAVFSVTVAASDITVPPVMGGKTRAHATVGALFTAPVDVDVDVEVTLVDAPSGMTYDAEAREVRWTPSAAQAIAAAGEMSYTLAAKRGDETRERTFLVRFDDRDGDGLSDAYESASGLSIDVANAPADGDGDTLDDLAEQQRGTRGDLADSDGDGLRDDAEVTRGTDARAVDSDMDGLVDGSEASVGADPTRADSDDDGMNDGTEVQRGTDPVSKSPDGDADGLSDLIEAQIGSDPALKDTDGDGCDDGVERAMGTNVGQADSDSDGASDCAERDFGLNPLVGGLDTDADNLSNDLERVLGTSPSDNDTDLDGWEDGIEVQFGSDPLLASSAPAPEAPGANIATLMRGNSIALELTRAEIVEAGEIEVFADADHDGAPDDYEDEHGYDASNPADGASDDDGDGIPMWREARFGTNPKSDDTDGDGSKDLDEVQAGSDPRDAESRPSTGPVTALEVYPARAGIVSNTLIGPGHLQLAVIGSRADGSIADLTAAARGSVYVVEPIEAGTVTADGYFTAASTYEGQARILVTNGTMSGASELVLSRFTPKVLATLSVPGANGRVAVAGPWALVATSSGVTLVDASEPSQPIIRSSLALGPVEDVAIRGTLGAAALGDGGVAWFDLGDPDQPAMLGLVPLAQAHAISLLDDRIVVGTSQGMHLVRLAAGGVGLLDGDGDEVDDRIVGTLYAGTSFTTLDRDATFLVAGTASGSLFVSRITQGGLSPDRAIVVNESGGVADAVVRGNVAAVALGDRGIARVSLVGAGIVVARDPTLNTVAIDATGALVIAANRVPTNPIALYSAAFTDALPLIGTVQASGTVFTGLAADRQYFFAVTPGQLQVGQHSVYSDLLGIPPRVIPQSPAPGGSAREGELVRVAVGASDDVAVESVILSMGDEDLATLSDPPYETLRQLDNVREPTEVTFTAAAFDPGQNRGEVSWTVTVVPVEDTIAPSGDFLEPLPEQLVASARPFVVTLNALDDYQVDAIELSIDGVVQKRLENPPWTTTLDAPATTSDPDGRVVVRATIIDFGENTTEVSRTIIASGVDLFAQGVTTIAATDTTFDGQDILIDRGTVTIEGAHTFGRLYVGPSGVLTQPATTAASVPAVTAITADLIVVQRGGAIDVSNKGYLGDCIAGDNSCGSGAHTVDNNGAGAGQRIGGSHGGDGGAASGGRRIAPYDDVMQPTLPGSGGGFGYGGGEPGGNGGGVVHLTADRVHVDGAVRADGGGGLGPPNLVAAGGAGGSIIIDSATLDGTGTISADGGAGSAAGGGGRVVVRYDDGDFPLGLVRARPGVSATGPAGAGTVVLVHGSDPAEIRVDDDLRSAGWDNRALGATVSNDRLVLDADLVVAGSSRLVLVQPLGVRDLTLVGRGKLSSLETSPTLETSLDVTARDVRVGAFAAFDVVGRGYHGDCNNGPCGSGGYTLGNTTAGGAVNRSGGSHGGTGGGGSPPSTYGDPWQPVTLGAGGSYGYAGGEPGGDGGGRIRVVASRTMTIDGLVDAGGGAAPNVNQQDGSGGAGGSVWVSAQTLTGTGAVRADGGAGGNNDGTAGGGGRVALSYTTLVGFSQATARPAIASAAKAGGPGTVTWQPASGTRRLVVDDGERSFGNDDRVFGNTWTTTPIALGADLEVGGATRLVLNAPLVANRVTLRGRAVLTHLQGGSTVLPTVDLTVTDLNVGAEAAIDVTGRGYAGDCAGHGCGAGAWWLAGGGGARQWSGGAHGGSGGGDNPNATYGSLWEPDALGAGGGYGYAGGEPGGDGGGRVRVRASGSVTLDGVVRADGAPGVEVNQRNGSGGAGGSIWITAPALTGAGSLSADGGAGGTNGGTAGGGGRIAIEVPSPGLDDADAHAYPGDGPGRRAGAGTIAWDGNTRRVVVDDGGRSDRMDNRALAWDASASALDLDADLFVRGASRLVVTQPLVVDALHVEDASRLSHLQTWSNAEHGLTITASSATITANAGIDVSARGYLGDCHGAACGGGSYWLGNTTTGGAFRSGGSHGGVGGGGSANATYGDLVAPDTLGAGGGYGYAGGEPGGDGGGRVHLVVAGRLELDGTLDADGEQGVSVNQMNGAGGAGGSIHVVTHTLAGSGEAHAHGGAGGTNGGHSGGGGRLAVHYQVLDGFDLGRLTAWPGVSTGGIAGSAGTVYAKATTSRALIVVDDGGLSAGIDNRVFGWDPNGSFEQDADVVIRGSTRAVASRPLVLHSLTLEDDALLTHLETAPGAERGLDVTATTLTIGPDAAIDVSARGYLGDCHGGACGGGAYAFGNTVQGPIRGGGSHGGVGGGPEHRVYGDPFAPTTLGGGGGYGYGGGEPGGDGGGRVRIEADTVVLDGEIHADGQAGVTQNGGDGSGGAGGSVWIVADVLDGAGLITANGGGRGPGGGSGGGGGRVALDFADGDFDTSKVSAFGGVANGTESGSAGSVWLAPTSVMRIDNNGVDAATEGAPWVEIGARAVSAVTADTITSNGAGWYPDMLVGLEVTGLDPARRYTVTANTEATLTVDPDDGDVAADFPVNGVFNGRRAFDGRLEIAGRARVALVDWLETSTLHVDDAVLTHRKMAGSNPQPALWIALTGAATIGSEGLVDLVGRGFNGSCAGVGCNGNATASTSGQFSGGSHGGRGEGARASEPFGDSAQPFTLGGGGGYGTGSGEWGGAGGGRVRFSAASLLLDGVIDVRGALGNSNGGAGAGGSVWIAVGSLDGSGAVIADGVDGAGAGGGGGRVRLDLGSDLFDGTVSVEGAGAAEDGTVVRD